MLKCKELSIVGDGVYGVVVISYRWVAHHDRGYNPILHTKIFLAFLARGVNHLIINPDVIFFQ